MKKTAVTTLFLFLSLFLFLLVQPTFADSSYTIQSGDTLASIARQFSTTVSALAQANNIVNPNLIYAGQTLIIPTNGSDSGSPPPPNPTVSTTYIVQAGDTLFRISLNYGVSVQSIMQANGLSNSGLIFVGQLLIISGGSTPVEPPPAPTQPTPTPQPAPPNPPAPAGNNLLTNGSFESGWYHQNGIPELQLPNGWQFAWDEGTNPFDSNSWSDFVRPETRVLSGNFLPPHEHDLFIWDGNQTVKIFKGFGAISFRLTQDVYLQPGTYQLTVNVFPDLVSGYDDGQKIWASSGAGGVQLLVGNGGSAWHTPVAGQRNTLTYVFSVGQAQTVRVGAAMNGRYALVNDGWFLDDWKLQKLSG